MTRPQLAPVVICPLVFLWAFIFLFTKYEHDTRDTVLLVSDEWRHQILGVNISSGHGYKGAAKEPLSAYRLDEDESHYNNPYYFDTFRRNKLFFSQRKAFNQFEQTPGYPVFLALIYKIGGVHPVNAQIAQMVLLAFCAAMMPLISIHYFRMPGFVTGLIAQWAFIKYFCPNPVSILTEPLIVFSLFIWALIFILWEDAPTLRRAGVLGLATGCLLLVKALTAILPFLTLIYILARSRFQPRAVRQAVMFTLCFLFCIAPWSIYASIEARRPVILATVHERMLLVGNNEDTLKTGLERGKFLEEPPSKDSRYIYNRMTTKNAYIKYLAFLRAYKKELPAFFALKLVIGLELAKLGTKIVFICSLLFYATIAIAALFRKRKGAGFDHASKFPIFPAMFFINMVVAILLFHGCYRYALPFIPFFLIITCYFPIQALRTAYHIGKADV